MITWPGCTRLAQTNTPLATFHSYDHLFQHNNSKFTKIRLAYSLIATGLSNLFCFTITAAGYWHPSTIKPTEQLSAWMVQNYTELYNFQDCHSLSEYECDNIHTYLYIYIWIQFIASWLRNTRTPMTMSRIENNVKVDLESVVCYTHIRSPVHSFQKGYIAFATKHHRYTSLAKNSQEHHAGKNMETLTSHNRSSSMLPRAFVYTGTNSPYFMNESATTGLATPNLSPLPQLDHPLLNWFEPF